MTEPIALSGLPLIVALTDLHEQTDRKIIAAAFKARRGIDAHDDAFRVQPLLWGWIKDRIYAGHLQARGVRDGMVEAELIPHAFLNAATPDYAKSALVAGSVTYHGVLISHPTNAGERAEPVVTYRTGAPGHPTSNQLWRLEMKSRHQRGDLASGVTAEATHLATWLKQVHPRAAGATAKTIENDIRAEYKTLRRAPER